VFSKILNKLNLEKVCVLYVILWIFVPPVQVGIIYRLLAVGCAGLWLLLVMLRDATLLNNLGKYLLIGALCLSLMLIWSLGVYSITTAITRNLQFIIMLVCGVMATYYMKTDKDFVHLLIGACLLAIVVFCVTTIVAVIEDPYAARIANSEWLEGRFEKNKNVGLYGYVYMCVLIAPMLLYKMLKKIKLTSFMDAMFLISFIAIVAMTALSGYMIANFCLLLGCGLVIIFQKLTIFRVIFFIAVIFAFVIFYQEIIEGFFKFLSALLGDNPAYGQKISEFKDLFLAGDAGGVTVDERFSNYQDSLALIYKYPIIGSFICGEVGGGGHSALFDMIGKYGWLITVLYFYLFWKHPFEIYKNKSVQRVKILMVVVIIFSIFDPYSQELSIALYLFFPYIIYIADNHSLKGALQTESTEGMIK